MDLTNPQAEATTADRQAVSDLMWAEDTDKLFEKYPCRCCCWEHTHRNCAARLWYGCRGI